MMPTVLCQERADTWPNVRLRRMYVLQAHTDETVGTGGTGVKAAQAHSSCNASTSRPIPQHPDRYPLGVTMEQMPPVMQHCGFAAASAHPQQLMPLMMVITRNMHLHQAAARSSAVLCGLA